MSLVDNLIERSPIRFADRLERALSGIPDTEQVLRLLYPDAPELEWGRIDESTSTSDDRPALSFAYLPSYVKRPQRGETRQ